MYKMYKFIIFIIVILTVYGSANVYIFRKGWRALPEFFQRRLLYTLICFILPASYILARGLQEFIPVVFHNVLFIIGSFWFAAVLYFFSFCVTIDITLLILKLFKYEPSFIKNNSKKTRQVAALIVIGLTVIIVSLGNINANNIKVSKLTIDIPKKAGQLESLNIVMASDFHLGEMTSRSGLKDNVKKINKLNPDIVLLVGDIVDRDISPLIRQDAGGIVKMINSKFGVFAVTGNHEFFGDVEKTIKYFNEHGVTFLSDEVIKINKSFYLMGRNDISITRFGDEKRKSLETLMTNLDKNLPVILMDHQPFNLGEAADNSVDLQFSGHTHSGQMFPISLIVKIIYEKSWGYLKKKDTHYYISSGIGTWGPPVKVGTISEIVNVIVNFK